MRNSLRSDVVSERVAACKNGLKNVVGSGRIIWAAGRRGRGAGHVIGGGCAGEAEIK